jgi:hypothetical protein
MQLAERKCKKTGSLSFSQRLVTEGDWDFMKFISDTHGVDRKFDTINRSAFENCVRRHEMKFNSTKQYIVIASLVAMCLASCSTNNSEDDASLQAEEPVAAASESPESSSEPSTEASQSPEAKPATSVATDTVAPAPTESVALQASARRVMYVKYDGVAIREKADAKSKRLGKLKKGDHVLVTLEGEWARTDDGKFIAIKGLSERGVGPSKKEATWSSGGKPADASLATPSPSSSSNSGASKPAEPAQKLPKKTKSSTKIKPADSAPAAADSVAPAGAEDK